MKNRKYENYIEIFNYLFEGTIENIIKCIEYNFQNKKIEKFNDIQLNVKGCKNIYESLKDDTINSEYSEILKREESLESESIYFEILRAKKILP